MRLIYVGILAGILSIKFSYGQYQWVPANIPLFPKQINCIHTDTVNNAMYVAGVATTFASPVNQTIARYKNGVWDTLGLFRNGDVRAVIVYKDTLYAGGQFNNAINPTDFKYIARYDGTKWSKVGDFDQPIKYFREINGELYAIGNFDTIDNVPIKYVAKYNGHGGWDSIAPKMTFTGLINDVSIYKGEIYISGNFADSAGTIRDIAVYKNNTWQQVDEGIKGGFSALGSMEIYDSLLILSGLLLKHEGNTGNGVQTWDGISFGELGAGLQDVNNTYNGNCAVYSTKLYKGSYFVGGGFGYAGFAPAWGVARWDGSRWCGYGKPEFSTNFTIGIYQDTIYATTGLDSVNGVYVNRLVKWTGGLNPDTCGYYLGVNEHLKNDATYSIYPNPAQDYFNVEITNPNEEELRLRLYNLLGEELYQKTFYTRYRKEQINTNHLSKGIYVVSLQSSNGKLLKQGKVVIQ